MKIHFELGDIVVEYEHHPMPESRFRALSSLGFYAIGGAVLLGAIHMVGAWAIAWAVGALVLVGLYRLASELFK